MSSKDERLTPANTRIIVDSSSNVPAELIARHGMLEVPALVLFGHDAYRNNIDMSAEEFYRRMREEDAAPTTSQPPPKEFADTYQQALNDGAAHLLVFTVASKLSGTYSSAVTAATTAENGFDQERILLWDSMSASMGSGWQAITAARLVEAGITRGDLEAHLTRLRAATFGFITVETLKYAARSGRVSNLQAGLGDLLQVKAVLEVVDGRVAPIGRVRGRKRALRDVVERYVEKLEGHAANLAVIHADAADEARKLADDARAAFQVQEMYTVDIGPAIASLIGPGTIGLIGHPVTEETPAAP